MSKISILHNNCKDFRETLFEELQKDYDIEFFITEPKRPLLKMRNVTTGRSIRIPKLSDFEFPKGLIKYLKSSKCDYYISTDLGYPLTIITAIFCALNNKNFILWNEQWADVRHPRRWITAPLERWVARSAFSCLAFGSRQRDYLISKGVSPSKIIVVPNVARKMGANVTEKFQEADHLKITCFARLIAFKGHRQLISGFALAAQETNVKMSLEIFGSGPKKSEIENLIDLYQVRDKVTLHSKTYDKEMQSNILENSDIVILPSTRTRTTEAWGLVLNEAMESGCLVIASSSVGSVDTLVRSGRTGMVFQDKSTSDLARTLMEIGKNPAGARKIANSGQRYVKRFYTTTTFCKIFEQAL